jgi:uncharacterized protein
MYRRHVLARARLISRRVRWFVYHNLLHADDPPERLARGVAIGMFITFTPTIGLQMVLVVFLAWLLRGNKVVGLPLVWISNPVTFVPIFYPCYIIGAMILGHSPKRIEWWRELGQPPDGMWDTFRFYYDRLESIAAPLWVGCVFVGLVLGLLSYFVVFHTVRSYRLRRWGKLVPPAKILPHHRHKNHAA